LSNPIESGDKTLKFFCPMPSQFKDGGGGATQKSGYDGSQLDCGTEVLGELDCGTDVYGEATIVTMSVSLSERFPLNVNTMLLGELHPAFKT